MRGMRICALTEGVMKSLLSVATIATVTIVEAASAAELPSYEVTGFPITFHQLSAVGATNVKEQSPNSSLTMAGMPASPHQVAVLTPRARVIEALVTTVPTVETSFSTR